MSDDDESLIHNRWVIHFFLSFQSQVKQSAAYQSGFPGLLTPHLGIIVSLSYATLTALQT